MPALQAIDGTSFVMLQSTSLKRAGDALPRHAYSQNCLAGKNTPPILQAAAVNPNKKLLLLTAVDEDSKPSASAEAPPLWAVANINVAAANQLHKARGDVVVPYQGPDIKDDYIHRIFFRVYEQPRQVPRHLLSDWGQLRSWMQSNRLLGEAARRGGGMSEFLLTAVRKRPNVTAFQDPFAVPLPLPRRQRKHRPADFLGTRPPLMESKICWRAVCFADVVLVFPFWQLRCHVLGSATAF
ncbi:unnamed protein product [Effrenium voratum]|nr:unnamed protein product [Effrenium voratum]